MNTGKLVFAQVMAHLPLTTFRRCVARYDGKHKVKYFTCLDQYLCMAFAQLTYRESLCDIEACLRSQAAKLYHMGFRSTVARNMLANANSVRDWRIHADFAQSLISIARKLYAEESFGVDLSNTVYATTIDLCLSVLPWAPFRTTKAAVKIIPCSTCAATYPASFTSAAASGTRSTSSACWCRRLVLSTSWTVATSTSRSCIDCIRPRLCKN
jgi:hypothetical protein